MAVVSMRQSETQSPKVPANGRAFVGLLVGGLETHNDYLHPILFERYRIEVVAEWTLKTAPGKTDHLPPRCEIVVILADSSKSQHTERALKYAGAAGVPVVRVFRRQKAMWDQVFERVGFPNPPEPLPARKPPIVVPARTPTPEPEGVTMPAAPARFGPRLRALRLAEGLSSEKLASTLDPPMSGKTLAQYENEDYKPTRATFDQLVMLFPTLAEVEPAGLKGNPYTPRVNGKSTPSPIVVETVESIPVADVIVEEKPAQTTLTLSPLDVAGVSVPESATMTTLLTSGLTADLVIVEEPPRPDESTALRDFERATEADLLTEYATAIKEATRLKREAARAMESYYVARNRVHEIHERMTAHLEDDNA